jgi:dGTPase
MPSRGRRYREADSAHRTAFARDRDRVIHSTAFRALKEKTQVFIAHEGDHYRTRLTHSLEVAQIARSIARALGLDADLAEALALAHDLGHPPFGHAGEEELERHMASFGGFDHNVQTFRVITALERRYPAFLGLNLCWESLEGVIKHNGPVAHRLADPAWAPVVAFDADFPLELDSWPSAEAQIAALSDDIAYNNHDVDDGLEAGVFTLDELTNLPLIGPLLLDVRADWPGLDDRLTRLEAVRRMIGAMVEDVIAETHRRTREHRPRDVREVRAMGAPLVAFSAEMNEQLGRVRQFLQERMYRHWRVNRTRSQARRILADMFQLFLSEPDVLPGHIYAPLRDCGIDERARGICDYLAALTDRSAIEEHRRLFQIDLWA